MKSGFAVFSLVLVAASVPACDGWRAEPNAESRSAAQAEDGGAAGDVAYYTCSMHPSVRSEVPGNCPICSMELTPVTRRDLESGTITIDAKRRQVIGLRTARAERRPFSVSIDAVGRVAYDDTGLTDVVLKLRGWIGELYVDSPGQLVEKGETLFTLYSPELYAAQEELLSALASQAKASQSAAPNRADYLVDAARRRLRLWDLPAAQIDSIIRAGKARQYVPIASPAAGYVVEKNVVEGTTVESGAVLYRLANLDRVWIEADVYESDLPLVAVGDAAVIRLPYAPGVELEGEVSFVYPYLDDATRTGRVRIELANPDLALRPDMYADVAIEKSLGERLVVPEQAVLYAGRRDFVFLDLGEGRLQPKAVEIGRRDDGWIEILEGVSAGDSVVTSGNFLVAAESRLTRDMEHWE